MPANVNKEHVDRVNDNALRMIPNDLPLEFTDHNRYVGKCDNGKPISYLFGCGKCGNEFRDEVHSKLPICKTCYPHLDFPKIELQIADYVKSVYDGKILTYDRTLLNGEEVDIYLPELKLAFDVKETYWNSYNRYARTKSFEDYQKWIGSKRVKCKKAGAQLITIYEKNYDSEGENIRQWIKERLSPPLRKIAARKCEVRKIEKEEARKFCDDYHMYGYISGTARFGLFHEDELVGAAIFKRYGKNYGLRLLCYKTGHYVIGGTDKIFKRFGKRFFHVIDLKYFKGKRNDDYAWAVVNMSVDDPDFLTNMSESSEANPEYYNLCVQCKRFILGGVGHQVKYFIGNEELL